MLYSNLTLGWYKYGYGNTNYVAVHTDVAVADPTYMYVLGNIVLSSASSDIGSYQVKKMFKSNGTMALRYTYTPTVANADSLWKGRITLNPALTKYYAIVESFYNSGDFPLLFSGMTSSLASNYFTYLIF
jgi:hypothetical protein